MLTMSGSVFFGQKSGRSIYIDIVKKKGQNNRILRFGKICSKLTLFWKYLIIYHFFSARVSQNRVLNSTWV